MLSAIKKNKTLKNLTVDVLVGSFAAITVFGHSSILIDLITNGDFLKTNATEIFLTSIVVGPLVRMGKRNREEHKKLAKEYGVEFA